MEKIDAENIEVFLFDLDGVLVNSFFAWYRTFVDTLERFGKDPIGEEEFRDKCWGYDLRTNMEKLGLGKRGADYAKSQFVNHLDKISILPETKPTLASIEKKIGLVTSTPSKIAVKILERFDLNGYFKTIIGLDKVKNPKPDPEPLLKACEELGTDPRKTVFIGDNKTDIEAGKAAGCKVIGLGVEADLKIDSLADLKKVLQ